MATHAAQPGDLVHRAKEALHCEVRRMSKYGTLRMVNNWIVVRTAKNPRVEIFHEDEHEAAQEYFLLCSYSNLSPSWEIINSNATAYEH